MQNLPRSLSVPTMTHPILSCHCHSMNGTVLMFFTQINGTDHCIGKTMKTSKSVLLEGYRSMDYDDETDLKFCTQISSIEIYQHPDSLMIGGALGRPHKILYLEFLVRHPHNSRTHKYVTLICEVFEPEFGFGSNPFESSYCEFTQFRP